jgi:hypothetical protein
VVVLRETRKIVFGKMREYLAQYAKIEARYQALGLPSARMLQKMGASTVVLDREWESLAAMEAGLPRAGSDPELIALRPALFELIESSEWELLWEVEG